MILQENFIHVLNDILTPQEITKALDGEGDYISLHLSIFNVGVVATIISTDYSEEEERDALLHGDLFCDKDTFLQICTDVKYIIEGWND